MLRGLREKICIGRGFRGDLDEVRLRRGAASPAWIAAELRQETGAAAEGAVLEKKLFVNVHVFLPPV